MRFGGALAIAPVSLIRRRVISMLPAFRRRRAFGSSLSARQSETVRRSNVHAFGGSVGEAIVKSYLSSIIEVHRVVTLHGFTFEVISHEPYCGLTRGEQLEYFESKWGAALLELDSLRADEIGLSSRG